VYFKENIRRSNVKKTKYDSMITMNKESPLPDWLRKLREKVPDDPSRGRVVTWVDNDVIPGAFYYESFIILKPTPEGYFNDPPHFHEDWDEVIGMFGTNPADPDNLGGEIQLTLGDEIRTFTKSCAVFVPRGLKHCPLVITKVSTPIILVTTGNSKYYTQKLTPDGEEMIKNL
jgi:hypothetical protein